MHLEGKEAVRLRRMSKFHINVRWCLETGTTIVAPPFETTATAESTLLQVPVGATRSAIFELPPLRFMLSDTCKIEGEHAF